MLRFRHRRNRLEHFDIVDTVEAVTASAASALSFLVDFIESELDTASFNQDDQDTLDEIRKGLSQVEAFVARRWKAIRNELKAAVTVVTCPRCGQDAGVLDDGFICRFCRWQSDGQTAAAEFISEILGLDHYRVVKDGGEWPCHACPECDAEALVDTGPGEMEASSGQFTCFACGRRWAEGSLEFCQSCEQPFECRDGWSTECRDCSRARAQRD